MNPVHQHTFATLSLALATGGRNHGMLQSLLPGCNRSWLDDFSAFSASISDIFPDTTQASHLPTQPEGEPRGAPGNFHPQ